ncbi:ubiquitin-conjugating enzyme E2 J2 [Octopus sinensis]|nr:ubiquitin-conjugating enzyme E2 J2 [Octopus sinensis]XP_036369220.1 ubiquitin-conjugating enzyme E2 J2 [Octopus sinensis]
MSGKRASTTATARLKQDYMRIIKDPVPYVEAVPLPSNILEWHYTVVGPENSPYEGGMYHGKLIFPREYPFKPPSIYMLTPSGRFKCNTRLCLSISDFHPDTWNPAWSVSTILTGLLSFMLEKSPTLGSLETSDYTKRQFASLSKQFNLQNKTYCELFPDIVENIRREQKLQQQNALSAEQSDGNTANGNTTNNPVQLRQNCSSGFSNAVINLLVVVVFAAFAYIVKYVLTSGLE